VTTISPSGSFEENVYDVVVVCTTTRTMNVAMSSLTDYGDEHTSVLPTEVSAAINNTSMISSSKVFIRTKKFWKDQSADFPRVILSDTLASQLYTLDYGHPDYGVVLLLYAWGEDSEQLMGIHDKQEMLRIIKARIANVTRKTAHPNYADYLDPVTPDDIDIVHWSLEESALGAFALTKPGQEAGTSHAFFSPLKIQNGIYVGGDGVSFNGGWTEGGLMTGMNIVSAVLNRSGELAERGARKAPVNLLIPDIYEY
jgi:tryptophan 2-monooxygenase